MKKIHTRCKNNENFAFVKINRQYNLNYIV